MIFAVAERVPQSEVKSLTRRVVVRASTCAERKEAVMDANRESRTREPIFEPGAPGEDPIRLVSEEAGRVTDIAAARAKGFINTARAQAEQAAEYVQDAVQQTRDKVAEYREAGFDRMKEDAIAYTRREPVTALCIAAGVGLVIGWLTALGRR
jgi:ElaB/YqjD/DUF883 family membrane-anchored ribosome-binding protein